MELIPIVILALVQGLTEFLPISSSAHLILAPIVFGWSDQGVAFDVAVHVGTLAAVLWYFRDDFIALFKGWILSIRGHGISAEGRLAWLLIMATLPIMVVGLALSLIAADILRSPLVIAWATLGFGLVLWWADRSHPERNGLTAITPRDALWIGLAQMLAVIPGASRSGVTISAGLIIGLDRDTAARFSFLLAAPIILLIGAVKTLQAVRVGDSGALLDLGLGALLSALVAYATIHLFLKLIRRVGLWPFVIYRLVLGGGLLIFIFSGNL